MKMNEADKHLLTLIREGNQDGWSQFVARFQARLVAYATRQVDQMATAEDLVQETFVGFLQSNLDYREQCELESFLFQILRRRIADHYRRIGQYREIPCCDFLSAETNSQASQDLTASTYAQRSEQQLHNEVALATAVEQLANDLRDAEKLRDLKIAEGLFYAQLRSVDVARLLNVSENEIAVVKRRLLERLARSVQSNISSLPADPEKDLLASNLLTSVWETMRPSCPKRTTLGKYTLKILPSDWEDFVRFHVETLGCTFCNANLVDLNVTSESSERSSQQIRFLHSTIGFLQRSSAAVRKL
jgi:RNA polymerase sigma factor (sigma-70 family)